MSWLTRSTKQLQQGVSSLTACILPRHSQAFDLFAPGRHIIMWAEVVSILKCILVQMEVPPNHDITCRIPFHCKLTFMTINWCTWHLCYFIEGKKESIHKCFGNIMYRLQFTYTEPFMPAPLIYNSPLWSQIHNLLATSLCTIIPSKMFMHPPSTIYTTCTNRTTAITNFSFGNPDVAALSAIDSQCSECYFLGVGPSSSLDVISHADMPKRLLLAQTLNLPAVTTPKVNWNCTYSSPFTSEQFVQTSGCDQHPPWGS